MQKSKMSIQLSCSNMFKIILRYIWYGMLFFHLYCFVCLFIYETTSFLMLQIFVLFPLNLFASKKKVNAKTLYNLQEYEFPKELI